MTLDARRFVEIQRFTPAGRIVLGLIPWAMSADYIGKGNAGGIWAGIEKAHRS
jgi:hypothetical protein